MSPLLPSSSKDASAGSNSSRGRSSATDKMIISRSRMLCSPYFVTAALLMLAVLMLKHWSLLDAHKEISLRLEGLHGKLKTESYNVENLKSGLRDRDELLQTCRSDKNALEQQLSDANKGISDVVQEKESCQGEVDKLEKDLVVCEEHVVGAEAKQTGLQEDLDQKQIRIKELEQEAHLQDSKIQGLIAEMATLKRKGIDDVAKVKGGDGNVGEPLLPGELPKVEPSAVHVKPKAVEGSKFHIDENGQYVPILPPGDPDKPRPKPQFSVGNDVVQPADQPGGQPAGQAAEDAPAPLQAPEGLREDQLVKKDLEEEKEDTVDEIKANAVEGDLGKQQLQPPPDEEAQHPDAKEVISNKRDKNNQYVGADDERGADKSKEKDEGLNDFEADEELREGAQANALPRDDAA